MARARKPSAPPPKSAFESLKPSQQVVVTAFTDPRSPAFLNQTQAYKRAHPAVTTGSAEVGGHRVLGNVKVAGAVASRLASQGITKDTLEDELKWNFERCKSLNRMGDHREAVLGLAKLRGDLVEKRADVTPPALPIPQLSLQLRELIMSYNRDSVKQPK